MARAFIGLGSNLGDREETLRKAISRLQETPGLRVLRISSLRETDPEGFSDQPRFLNGVAELETDLDPRSLLQILLSIEQTLGRVRPPHLPPGGPRTIDLDLLLYDRLTLNEPDLILPHPRMLQREFVLTPLAELAPELVSSLERERHDQGH